LAFDTARQPDVAFANHERQRSMPLDRMAPNLAVEVISDSETAYSARKKVSEYLAAGVEEIWQVYPEIRLVIVHTPTGIREVSAGELIESPLLPGFSARVAEFFEI
jgi:Uma2 family endonuclease